MARIYYYKLTHDAGAAPCVQRGLLSMAICKPMIRTGAKEGDLIFGFTANSLDARNRLIYAACITKKLPNGEYYTEKFAQRHDCIYKFQRGRYVRREDAKFHDKPGDLTHDLGEPPDYSRVAVLLSADFRYFGINGTDEFKSKYELIRKAVESLGRGQRVNLAPELREQFLAMKKMALGQEREQSAGSTDRSTVRQ
jgi:hypothetical protein